MNIAVYSDEVCDSGAISKSLLSIPIVQSYFMLNVP